MIDDPTSGAWFAVFTDHTLLLNGTFKNLQIQVTVSVQSIVIYYHPLGGRRHNFLKSPIAHFYLTWPQKINLFRTAKITYLIITQNYPLTCLPPLKPFADPLKLLSDALSTRL